ncbi:MAG: sugar-binding protein [Cytophagaceae bacterium]
MKRNKVIYLFVSCLLACVNNLTAQRGYFNAPYVRYEADLGTLSNATITAKSYKQSNLQSEASDQVCVNMSASGASVSWTLSAAADGLLVRYSIPDGQSGILDVYADNILIDSLKLSTYYSWENLGFTNANPKMRFDEVRLKLASSIPAGGTLQLVNRTGNISLDFAELEPIPSAVSASAGDFVYTGNGSDLQTIINGHGGDTIYLPAGVYNVNRELYFGVDNTVLKGAGMWYTEIHFTNINGGQGGLRANANDISYSGLYLSTVRNSRSNSYKAINGVYTGGSLITEVWAEHFECGAWIGQYNNGGPAYADGFTMSACRFRNNFADGINLCKGTSNAIVEYCSFRNNGDDDMAIWSANGFECRNNTFRYNTSENCWRASGCAIYGGYNNQAHHLLIKDNVEVGIRVNNSYSGVGFNDNGMHVFSDITLQGCGTFNDLWNSAVGAIDLVCDNIAGTRVQNVKFSNIDIIDSKNDAIYFYKKNGEGFYNLIFENINIDGTGTEYPDNNANSLNWGRGYGILFVGNPSGYGINCNMTVINRGGNATVNTNSAQKGPFSWTSACIPVYAPVITSAAMAGICDDPVTLMATATAPSGDTVSYVEFFVDNVSVGQSGTASYSAAWNNTGAGSHQIKAIAHYGPSNTSAASYIQNLKITEGIYSTAAAPVIDGSIDAVWSNYAAFPLGKIAVGSFSGASDLTASFRIARDAVNLYILVDVTDDILRNDGAANWQKDGVEIYIDMGNDKNGYYIPNSDYQYGFVWGVSTAQPGVTFAQTTKSGNLGYIMEIMIPWSTLNGAPSAGDFMGFDLHVEDNDSGNRNGKKVWADNTDNAWQSTMVLGTLQMAGCTNTLTALSPNSPAGKMNGFTFYPNPFEGSGNLLMNAGGAGNYTITIRDITGKLISSEMLAGDGPYVLGVNMPSGIYLLEVSDGSSRQAIKLIKF